ncbi:MAG: hypothetical protein KQH83_04925 [Actinobacteria bacterium]|jgi:hypothetical protein|nr:hypothetical protein [Actinomycetota bacterium]
MKDRFKAKEWDSVLRLPILMFHFVSLADHELQPEEIATFVGELQQGRAYKDPLHRAAFTDLAEPGTFKVAFDTVMGPMTDSAAAIEKEFKATRKVLQKRLSNEEYHRFFVSLTGTGLKIAAATGEGPHNIAAREAAAIAVFIDKFGVDMDAGKAALARL